MNLITRRGCSGACIFVFQRVLHVTPYLEQVILLCGNQLPALSMTITTHLGQLGQCLAYELALGVELFDALHLVLLLLEIPLN